MDISDYAQSPRQRCKIINTFNCSKMGWMIESVFLIESDRVLPIPRPSRYRVKTLTDENHEWEQSGGMGLASEGLVGVGGIGVGWVIGNDWHCQAPPFTQFNSCWNAWLTFTASTSTCALHLISSIFFTVSQLIYKKPINLWIVKICFSRADFTKYCTMHLFLVGVIFATEVEAVWVSFGLKRVERLQTVISIMESVSVQALPI